MDKVVVKRAGHHTLHLGPQANYFTSIYTTKYGTKKKKKNTCRADTINVIIFTLALFFCKLESSGKKCWGIFLYQASSINTPFFLVLGIKNLLRTMLVEERISFFKSIYINKSLVNDC